MKKDKPAAAVGKLKVVNGFLGLLADFPHSWIVVGW